MRVSLTRHDERFMGFTSIAKRQIISARDESQRSKDAFDDRAPERNATRIRSNDSTKQNMD